MQIGIVYPQTELRGDPEAVRRIGMAVERLGFDHLLAYDHVLGAVHADRTPPLTGPYTEHHQFHDPFVMFAHLAAITERINFAISAGVKGCTHRNKVTWSTSMLRSPSGAAELSASIPPAPKLASPGVLPGALQPPPS
jgi:hypothetical protein